ncbi:5'a2rel-related protein [Leptomonas pyrrhocoris]|uniref:5'a2rel-related protein n=1 Tax=Leptomonas pyrrhocoris TaxID=157538 RepID=A0A0M9G9Z3_LEPPY|nr:5'a2rel-related protein [Leptomonas pyrrhocoris]KPA85676.1 5'a2rel-related protein [Leptomonas pyrrhocoris]|eukprot:XP_015664115.1 5'a2rel-related protein [Leptomonas pyrrhocoris]
MDISIGSSSSSYSSEPSESSPAGAHRYHHHQHSNNTAAEPETACEDVDTHNATQLRDTEATPKQPYHDDTKNPNGRNVGEIVHAHRYSNGQFRSHSDEFLNDQEAPDVSTTASLSAHPRGEEVFYTISSRDSVSPRYTPSNSLPFNPSFTVSSVPPPPLPPSPKAMEFSSQAPFRFVVPRQMGGAAPGTTSLEREPADEDVAYLRRADQPLDPSTPPRLPSPSSTGARSPPNAFVRTESPSRLQKGDEDASTSAATGSTGHLKSAEPGRGAGAARSNSEGKTSGTSDGYYQPLHLPALKNLADTSSGGGGRESSSNEADANTVEVRGLSEASDSGSGRPNRYATLLAESAEARAARAAARPPRSARPLPCPTAPVPSAAATATTSASSAPSSRVPSRSVESSHSPSRYRAGEPRFSLGRAGEDSAAFAERRPSWRDDAERAESASVTDYGARPPSHAPTLDLDRDAAVSVGNEDERRWQQSEASASHQRSRSKSSKSEKRNDGFDNVGVDVVEGAKEDRQQDQRVQAVQTSPSPAPSSAASSVGEVPRTLFPNGTSVPAGAPQQKSADSAKADVHERSSSANRARQEVADPGASSISPTTPADTVLSSDTGRQNDNHRRSSDPDLSSVQATGAAAAMRGTRSAEESPPPLPPAPWRIHAPATKVKTDSAEVHHATARSAPLHDEPHNSNTDAASERRDAHHPRSSPHENKQSALDRWRSGVACTQGKGGVFSPGSASLSDTAKPDGSTSAASQRRDDADVYKGGVDFVRWVPTSLQRDADLSGASLTPPRRGPGEARAADANALSSSEGAAARVVAVPLVPSPHRKPNRNATTAAVLAEVAQRRNSASLVSGGVRWTPQEAAAAPLSTTSSPPETSDRQRIRLSTITSPQLTRDANRSARAYVDHQGREAMHRTDFPHHTSGYAITDGAHVPHDSASLQANYCTSGQPVDAWSQQRSGCFLTSAALSSRHGKPFHSPGSWNAVGGSDANEPSSSPHQHSSSGRDVVNVDSAIRPGGHPMRPELDAALASRPAYLNSFSDAYTEPVGADDEASDMPTVVRTWRPLSAVMSNSLLLQLHRPTQHTSSVSEAVDERGTPMGRWTHGVSAATAAAMTNIKKKAFGASAAAALSIDVSDSTRRSSSSLLGAVHTRVSSEKENSTADHLTDAAHTHLRSPNVAPGYMAVYGPRTLSTRVLQARDALLVGVGPQASAPRASNSFFNGKCSVRRGPANHSDPALGSSEFPCVSAGTAGGSRAMPAFGAAVSTTLSADSLRGPPRTTFELLLPPHVRVDLSRTPLRGPSMAEVLSNSYDDTAATATFADVQQKQPLVGALARRQGEKVEAAMAEDPWSLFLERDGVYPAADTSTTREPGFGQQRRPPQPPQPPQNEEVARRIPFGFGVEAAEAGGGSDGGRCQRAGDALPPAQTLHQQDRTGSTDLVAAPATASFASPLPPSELSRATTATASGSRPRDFRSASTTEPDRLSSMSLVQRPSAPFTGTGPAEGGPQDARDHEHLCALAERNVRHTHVVEQQRLMQEEAFRRRQIVMQQYHSFTIAVTELNYQRAVTYVQHAAGAAVVAPPATALEYSRQGKDQREVNQAAGPPRFVGLPSVRRDQAAMAASLDELSKELDSMPA